MFWDKEYERNQRLWGDAPSELARITVDYILKKNLNKESLKILDIGCGYGRDTLYLGKSLDCSVIGVDNSPSAIEIALKSLDANLNNVEFKCCGFTELGESKFDIVFAANLYQVLPRAERLEFRKQIASLLKPKGLLFLNSLSINDPEEYGKGQPCADEANSFIHNKFLHFCSLEELEQDFSFLKLKELYEHEYVEPRAEGKDHHHISWIVIGELP